MHTQQPFPTCVRSSISFSSLLQSSPDINNFKALATVGFMGQMADWSEEIQMVAVSESLQHPVTLQLGSTEMLTWLPLFLRNH